MKVAIRNSLAAFFRALPYFRGKYRLGPALIPLLTDYKVEQDCMVTLQMRNGSIMRLDLRSFIEQRVFFAGEYDGGIIQRLFSVIKPDSNVFDVGANIGFYSIALGHQIKKMSLGAKIWAFEPIESNFDRLTNLIKINELTNVICPVKTALGNQEGEIQLYLVDRENYSSTGNAFWLKGSLISTIKSNFSSQIVKLDTFTQKHNIQSCDLIKVDIEGAELEFLQGGIDFITKCRPIIYSELNPFWVEKFGYSFIDVAELVKPWDYKLYKQQGRQSFVEIKEPKIGLTDILMIPQEKSHSILFNLGVSQ